MSNTNFDAIDTGVFSSGAGSSTKRLSASRIVITVFLIFYTVLTIFPFYILFVRTFVPTANSTELHLWIPEVDKFNLDSRLGNILVFLNMDTKAFKERFGIKGYLSPNLSFNQLADQYDIDKEDLRTYMQPILQYNGWFTILTGNKFIKSLFATIYTTAGMVVVGGFLGVATGSILAGFRKRWHLVAYNLYMLQMIIPPVMVMIPQFLIVRNLHLFNTYFGLILFHVKGGALPAMIFTSYIAQIPKDLKESVEIDGGSFTQYFFNILLPLCKVPFATFAAILSPWFWNDLLYPLLFLKQDKYTLVPWINTFIGGEFATNYQVIYTGLFLTILPIVIVYFLFQKFFVKAALSGALKG